MSWLRKLKIPDTASSVRAVGGPLFKLPWASRKETAEAQVFDTSRRLAEIELDRIILFKGKWHLPPVTVKPRFEAWNHVRLEPETKPEPDLLLTDPKIHNIFRTRNLVLVGAALLGFVGIRYYLRQQRRKRFAANLARAVAGSAREAVEGAVVHAVEGAIVHAVEGAFQIAVCQVAIDRALQNAVHDDVGHTAQNVPTILNAAAAQNNLDVDGALVRALQNVGVKDAIGQSVRDAIASVQTSNVTAGEVTEGHLDASVEQEANLGTFLQTLGVIVSEPSLQSGAVKVADLVTSSVDQLVKRGLSEDAKGSLVFVRPSFAIGCWTIIKECYLLNLLAYYYLL